MADNLTLQNTGTGALPNATVIATRDTGTSHWQQVDAAPAPSSIVAGAQYYLQVTTGATVTLTVPSNATHAIISVDSGGAASGVRWTADGSTTPTATVGHFLAAGDALYMQDNLASLKFLAVTGTAYMQVSYFRYL